MSKLDDFKRINAWPHVREVEDHWEGILRSQRNDEVIRWKCGHSHVSQRDAKGCAMAAFKRRLAKADGQS